MENDALLHLEFQCDSITPYLKSVLNTELFNHQKTLISWASYRELNLTNGCSGGFIMDEPGLGKTLSVLCLIVTRKLPLPTLVICPSHLIQHWINEINTHFKPNTIKYAQYFGSKRHKLAIDPNVDIIFTSYGTVRNDFANSIFDAVKHRFPSYDELLFPCFRGDSILNSFFGRLVLDESHNIRSKTITASACLNISAHHSWCISATPIMNRIDELQNQVALLGIYPYDNECIWHDSISMQMTQFPVETFNMIMKNIIIPFSIRRVKSNFGLVERNETNIWLEFSEEENSLYQYLLDFTKAKTFKVLQNMKTFEVREKNTRRFVRKMKFCITVFILRLRQACCHPEIVIRKVLEQNKKKNIGSISDAILLLKQKIDEGLKEECCICFSNTATYSNRKCSHCICKNCSESILDYNIFNCPLCRIPCRKWYPAEVSLAKMEEINTNSELDLNFDPLCSTKLKWLHENLHLHNDKVVIVSQWTEYLNIIARYLSSYNITYTYLNGNIAANLRHIAVKEFQENPNIRICLLSLCASSEGINLTSACKVYHMDPWWNTARATQASDRIHRLGQTKDVSIQHVFIRNSVEEAIFDMQQKKQNVTNVLYGNETATSEMTWANAVKLILNEREVNAYLNLRKQV